MGRLWMAVRRFLGAEHGQDLTEYAMLASLIAIVAVGAVTAVGQQIKTVLWQLIASSI